jgi:hypothetical protein
MKIRRRSFLSTVGASAVAMKMGLLDFASSLFGQDFKAAGKPRVVGVFLRPDVEEYWMGWPGAQYDIKARQADYTRIMTEAANRFGVKLELSQEPLAEMGQVNAFLEKIKPSPPDGVILTAMSLNAAWPMINHFVDQRGDVPTIVFSPMGTSFTGHLQPTRGKPKTFVAATQDIDWLAEAVKMFRVMWDMKESRLCIVRGKDSDGTRDQKLDVIGTTLHYIPESRWIEQFKKTETSDEVRAIADYYTKEAKKIVEPTAEDILNAAKMYVVARKIMADEKCQGMSVNCLPMISNKLVPCGPCIAWSKLNDELSVGACEADWNAAISLRLNALLNGRPGFMQDPAPNTVNNTLMGAHCSCPAKLDGPDKPHAPFILRTHSEPNKGVAPQVLWRIGQEATVMKFLGPKQITVGTGRVVANIDTPPAGGCRTSVELEMDDVADARDCRGFHQLFIYGKLDRQFMAYGQLAGIEVIPIA